MQDNLNSAPGTGTVRRDGESGQTLVEFAMVIPMVVVLLLVMLELALALNASLAVNRASQHGAHMAASGGNILGTDCLILERIENDLGAPNEQPTSPRLSSNARRLRATSRMRSRSGAATARLPPLPSWP